MYRYAFLEFPSKPRPLESALLLQCFLMLNAFIHCALRSESGRERVGPCLLCVYMKWND